jgi:MHS family proline/betaine transporter-like MFS transporter
VLVRFVLCSSLEWYNFMSFVSLGPLLIDRFFPPKSLRPSGLPNVSLPLALFFLVCLLALAGLPFAPGLFYAIKGRQGRVASGGWATYLSAMPPLVGALLPVYQQAWVSTPLLLLVLMLLQTLALGRYFGSAAVLLAGRAGGDAADAAAQMLPGAALRLAAAAAGQGRAGRGSLVLLPLALGATGAAGSCAFTALVLPGEAFQAWGWRIPLALSVPGCLLGALLKGLVSDPEDGMTDREVSERYGAGGFGAVRGAKAAAALGAALGAAGAAAFGLAACLLPSYLVQLGGLGFGLVSLMCAANMLALALALPLGGWLADRVGSRRKLMLGACVALALLAHPLWLLLGMRHIAAAWIAQLLLVLLAGLAWGPLPSVLVELFPEGLQVGGVAAAHHLALVLFAGAGPLAAVGLLSRVEAYGSLAAPAAVQALAAVCSGVGMLLLKAVGVDV